MANTTQHRSRAEAIDRYLELRPIIRARMEAAIPDDVRRDFGELTPHQLRALLALGAHGLTMRQLARAMGVSPATATVLGDRLVTHDLAERCQDTEDRRRVRLVPTARGRALAERGRQVQRGAADRLLSQLTETQIAAWLDVLETLAAHAHAPAGTALPVLEGAR